MLSIPFLERQGAAPLPRSFTLPVYIQTNWQYWHTSTIATSHGVTGRAGSPSAPETSPSKFILLRFSTLRPPQQAHQLQRDSKIWGLYSSIERVEQPDPDPGMERRSRLLHLAPTLFLLLSSAHNSHDDHPNDAAAAKEYLQSVSNIGVTIPASLSPTEPGRHHLNLLAPICVIRGFCRGAWPDSSTLIQILSSLPAARPACVLKELET